MSKNKYQKMIRQINEIRESELSSYWDHHKFINSMLFHQIAVNAAIHYQQHHNSTNIMQVLDFAGFKGIEYLKAVRWFEYRTGQSFIVIDKKLKKSPINTLNDENYQIFGEFIKTYKGALPEIKISTSLDTEKENIEKSSNSGKDQYDEYDLIQGAPMRIGGRNVYGGYGTGKRK